MSTVPQPVPTLTIFVRESITVQLTSGLDSTQQVNLYIISTYKTAESNKRSACTVILPVSVLTSAKGGVYVCDLRNLL